MNNTIAGGCILGCALALASCCSTEKYDNYLNGWVGHSKTDLIGGWGIPHNSYKADKNTEFLQYNHHTQIYHSERPGETTTTYNPSSHKQTTTYTAGSPAYTETKICVVTFKVVKNKVEGVSRTGEYCCME